MTDDELVVALRKDGSELSALAALRLADLLIANDGLTKLVANAATVAHIKFGKDSGDWMRNRKRRRR